MVNAEKQKQEGKEEGEENGVQLRRDMKRVVQISFPNLPTPIVDCFTNLTVGAFTNKKKKKKQCPHTPYHDKNKKDGCGAKKTTTRFHLRRIDSQDGRIVLYSPHVHRGGLFNSHNSHDVDVKTSEEFRKDIRFSFD